MPAMRRSVPGLGKSVALWDLALFLQRSMPRDWGLTPDWCCRSRDRESKNLCLSVRERCSGLIATFPLEGPVDKGGASLPSRGAEGTGVAIRSFTACKASGIMGIIRCQGPLPLLGVGSGARVGLETRMGEDTSCVDGNRQPNAGRAWSPMPFFSFFGTSKSTCSACAFFGFFLGTGDGNLCWEDNSAGGALHTKANVLSAESNWLDSDASLSADFIRRACTLMSQSFLV